MAGYSDAQPDWAPNYQRWENASGEWAQALRPGPQGLEKARAAGLGIEALVVFGTPVSVSAERLVDDPGRRSRVPGNPGPEQVVHRIFGSVR